jgi:Skp family chaperone for outer membrane proteins
LDGTTGIRNDEIIEKPLIGENMKKIIFFVLAFFIVMFFFSSVNSAVLSTVRIAYVDIEKVFDGYKETKAAKEKISEELRLRKEKVIRLEAEIRKLEKKLNGGPAVLTGLVGNPDVLTGLIEEAQVGGNSIDEEFGNEEPSPPSDSTIASSTGTSKAADIKLLEKKKEELSDISQNVQDDFLYMEENIRKKILGQIYDIIEEISEAEGYNIIISKENILYSKDEGIDLTDEVIKRLNKN